MRLRPSFGYGALRPEITHGSNHIRYVSPDRVLRLTTDAPVELRARGDAVPAGDRGELRAGRRRDAFPTASGRSARAFQENTEAHWRQWTRRLAIPPEWQDAVIRAAITLKLCTFEETGAIVAAMTTSIPEAPRQRPQLGLPLLLAARRVLRRARAQLAVRSRHDGALPALPRQHRRPGAGRPPAAGVRHRAGAPPRRARGGDARRATAAWGRCASATRPSSTSSTTSTATSCSRRRRPSSTGACCGRATAQDFARLERVGEQAYKVYATPDASMWELRTRERVHTSSALMCWAACDRLARIAAHRALPERERLWQDRAAEIRARHRVARLRSRARQLHGELRRLRRRGGPAADGGSRLPAARTTRASPARSPRSSSACGAARTCSAMPPPTTSACRRPPSTSAPSGTSTRSRASAARRRRASSSSTCSRAATTSGLLSEDIDPATRRALGQLPADLLAGRHHQCRDAALARLGDVRVKRPGTPRRRVEPRRAGARAPPPRAASPSGSWTRLREHGGLWFGWSGRTAPAGRARLHTEKAEGLTLATLDLDAARSSTATTTASATTACGRCCISASTSRASSAASSRATAASTAASRRRSRSCCSPTTSSGCTTSTCMPLAEELRRRGARQRIGFFLHTPFPPTEILTTLPVHEALTRALFAYDLLGFQTDGGPRALPGTTSCAPAAGARAATRSAPSAAKSASARSRSASTSSSSTATPSPRPAAASSRACAAVLRGRDQFIGVDRLDYSKGLLRRMDAFGRYLENYPRAHGKVILLQVAPVSRGSIESYRNFRQELDARGGARQRALRALRLDAGALPQPGVAAPHARGPVPREPGRHRDADAGRHEPGREGIRRGPGPGRPGRARAVALRGRGAVRCARRCS